MHQMYESVFALYYIYIYTVEPHLRHDLSTLIVLTMIGELIMYVLDIYIFYTSEFLLIRNEYHYIPLFNETLNIFYGLLLVSV